MNKFKNYVAYGYIFAVLFIISFYYQDEYFDMLASKANCYEVVVGIALSFIVVFIIDILYGNDIVFLIVKFFSSFNLMDTAVAVFGISSLISCIFSYNAKATFWGDDGWHMGAFVLSSLCLVYFFISRCLKYNKDIIWGMVLISGIATFVLGLLNSISIDPLKMHERLMEKDMFRYIVTMGNINTYAGYVSMIVPVFIFLSIFREENIKKSVVRRIICDVAIVLGFINVFVCNSDGVYFGVVVSYVIMLYYSASSAEKLNRVLRVGVLYSLSACIINSLKSIYKDDMVSITGISAKVLCNDLWEELRNGKDFLANLCSCTWFWIAVICSILSLMVLMLKKVYDKKVIFAIRITLIAGTAFCVSFIISDAVKNFCDTWGTNRGFIWSHAIMIFEQFDIKDKIFGYGTDGFGVIIHKLYNKEIVELFGLNVLNAHNEFLQYLITMGIIGLFAYLSIWISVIKEIVKSRGKVDEKMTAYFAALGYMGQAVVNNPQAFNMAVLFLMLAISRNVILHENEEKVTMFTKYFTSRKTAVSLINNENKKDNKQEKTA